MEFYSLFLGILGLDRVLLQTEKILEVVLVHLGCHKKNTMNWLAYKQ